MTNPNQKEITWTHSKLGDSTPNGQMMKNILMKVIKERAEEGYTNERDYLNSLQK